MRKRYYALISWLVSFISMAFYYNMVIEMGGGTQATLYAFTALLSLIGGFIIVITNDKYD